MHQAQIQERITLLALLSQLLVIAIVTWQLWPLPAIASGVIFGGFVLSALLLRRLRMFHARAREQARLCEWYERGIARLNEKWQGQGIYGDEFAREAHPYQCDLHILGSGSLFELLATTRSTAGAERLAAYLLDPADISTVRARQIAVVELQHRTAVRESLALAGTYAFQECNPRMLRAWLRTPILKTTRVVPVMLFLCSVCSLVLGFLTIIGFLTWQSTLPFLLPPLFVQTIVGLALMRRVRVVLEGIASLGGEFSVLQDGLTVMRSRAFASEKLRTLAESLGPDAVSYMKGLARLVHICEQRRKDILYQFSLFLGLGTQLALAIERWRDRHGANLAIWLDAFAEFEALNAIACYAYEHPGDVFPEITEGSASFHARNLGHPLLPYRTCVGNNLNLDSSNAFCLITGSNMAGKSTWLRAVGAAAVLAAAGAPVRATSLRMSLFTVFASISIVDSLATGKSKFFAEVERLRATIHAAQHQPSVMFLIDEILSGTNSADRHSVAESVLGTLVSAGAVGLLSTHDSSLVSLAEGPRLRGQNVHMGSENPDDPLDFDFRVKPGPVRCTNAIAIARMVGIPEGHTFLDHC